jgi:hypothetical protein
MPVYNILASDIWGDFIIALVGAVVGGLFTLIGSYFANKHQASIENDLEKASVRDFILSIEDELTLAWVLYHQNIGLLLEKSPPKQPFRHPWQASGNYFRIYESNLHLLPKISDEGLRKQIIRTYFYANSLVDSLHMNTKMLKEEDELRTLTMSSGSASSHRGAALNSKTTQLANYRDELHRIHVLTRVALDELTRRVKLLTDS